jgi:3-oxoadipate enol-lactonase
MIVRSNGADLSVRLDGPEGQPWIVLSNGLATTTAAWDPQIAMLTRTHRVLRYDSRGHGNSSSPPGPYTFKQLEDDLLGLMDHFAIAQADLLGLSMGGMTTLGLAIAHPDRVGRVICCDARSEATPAFIASWDSRIEAIRRSGGMQGIVDSTVERWFTPAFVETRPAALAQAQDMILATDPEGYIACAAALKTLDYKRLLHQVQAPVLFLCGAQDQAAPPAEMRAMADLTPRGSYVEIDPGAHVCNLENPAAFNTAVADWLATARR